MHLYTSQLLLINRKPKTGDVQTKRRSIKPTLFSCRSLRFRCDNFAIFCTVSGSLGVFKMLVLAANTCIFQTFTLFTVDIPRCLAMYPILLLLELLFGSSLTKIRREISQNLLVFQISFAPFRCFLASRHKSICQKIYVCPHESSSEKDAPKKLELCSLRRHIQKPKTNFFRCPNIPKTTQTFKLKNCLFLQHPTEN